MAKAMVIRVERAAFLEVVRFVSESVTGATVPLVTRIQAVEDSVPLLRDLVAALGAALDRIEVVRQESIESDPERLKEFLQHSEHVARLEGSIAALLVVGEELQRQKGKKTPRRS